MFKSYGHGRECSQPHILPTIPTDTIAQALNKLRTARLLQGFNITENERTDNRKDGNQIKLELSWTNDLFYIKSLGLGITYSPSPVYNGRWDHQST